MNKANIIIKPLITEASMKAVDGGKYSFAVAKQASKTDVREALKQMFNVNVISVATSVIKGKTKRVGVRRTEVKDSIWKKAVVTLKKGEKISLFEPGGDDHAGHTHSK